MAPPKIGLVSDTLWFLLRICWLLFEDGFYPNISGAHRASSHSHEMAPKKQPKNPNPHPHRATDNPSGGEDIDPIGEATNANDNRDKILSPTAPSRRSEGHQDSSTEDVAQDDFEVGLHDAGVEDQDIHILRRVERRLEARLREVPASSNVRTRAQAEAAVLRAKGQQVNDLEEEKASILTC